ncbi:MAG: hypothetical protein NDI90_13260 [Nitrospira sp. BO4]|jgi:hypothetical protein|nr:hypothetical protein [Nitrospira sp. BO4]
MKKRQSFNDPKAIAHDMLQAIAGEPVGTTSVKRETSNTPTKNPAAVALGRLGGLKGGKARAAKLSATKRTRIAKQAAQSRWRKNGA